MRKVILITLLFPFFLSVCFAKAKKEKIDFSDPVILEGSVKDFKNSCFTGIKRPIKLYDQFLEARLELHNRLKKFKAFRKARSIFN